MQMIPNKTQHLLTPNRNLTQQSITKYTSETSYRQTNSTDISIGAAYFNKIFSQKKFNY